jgi:integrase
MASCLPRWRAPPASCSTTTQRDANVPKVPKSEIRPPAHDDVVRLLAGAAGLDFEWLIWLRLDAMTGARRGEVCAVRINKLDFASGELRMDRGSSTPRPRWA